MNNPKNISFAFLPIGIVFLIIGIKGKPAMLAIGIVFLMLSIGAFAKSKKDSAEDSTTAE